MPNFSCLSDKSNTKRNLFCLTITAFQVFTIVPAIGQTLRNGRANSEPIQTSSAIHRATIDEASDSIHQQTVWSLVSIHRRGPLWETLFHGSAWLLNVTDTTAIFVSANHVIVKGPLADQKNGLEPILFLAQPHGVSIQFFFSDIRHYPDCDTVLIVVPRERISDEITLKPEKTFTGSPEILASFSGSTVINLGYPLSEIFQKRTMILGTQDNPIVFYRDGPWLQRGEIHEFIGNFSLQAYDLQLNECDCVQLNYLSTDGFSGGPVVLENRGEIIGMLLGSIANGWQPAIAGDRIQIIDYRGAYVLSVFEILRLLEDR